MNTEKKRHVLLIYRKMIPSIRLCGHCQLEWLAEQGKLEYRAIQEMELKAADLKWAEIVLLGRSDDWYEYQVAKWIHDAGKYLIYMIDDDLLNIPSEISSAAYYGLAEIQNNIRGMIALSNAILSPSPVLLEKYATDGHKAIQIDEPAIDPVEYKPHDPSKPIKIGFAGSIDRACDLDRIMKDALIQIKRKFGDRVEFWFFGAIPIFADELDAKCIPYCDSYEEYRWTLNSLEWDIGLAPMPDTPFHKCKHYNKFVEYAAAGIAGVYSKTEPYTRLESNNGLYFVDNHEWYKRLMNILADRALLEEMRKCANEFVLSRFSIKQTAEQLWKKLDEIHISAIMKDNRIPLSLFRFCEIWKRCCRKVQMFFSKRVWRISK